VRLYGEFLARGTSVRPDEATVKNMLLAIVYDAEKIDFELRQDFLKRVKKDSPRYLTVTEYDELKEFVKKCLLQLQPPKKKRRGIPPSLDRPIAW
jgi:phosphoenolpyruvate synthase/pyruvate phosphate dikinase